MERAKTIRAAPQDWWLEAAKLVSDGALFLVSKVGGDDASSRRRGSNWRFKVTPTAPSRSAGMCA